MTTLFEILPGAEGAEFIRDCWGELPQFNFIEILHLKHSIAEGGAEVSILAVIANYRSENENEELKASKMVIRFREVSRFEYLDAFGGHPSHGVKLDAVFTGEAPEGVLAIATDDGFYIACRSVRVESCIRYEADENKE